MRITIIIIMMIIIIIIMMIIIKIMLIPTDYCFLFVFYSDVDQFPETFENSAREREKISPSVRHFYGNHAAREKSLRYTNYSSDIQTIQFSLPIIIEETKRLFATRRTATPTDSNWLDTFDVTAA